MNGSSSLRLRSTFAKNSGDPSGASPWAAPHGSASQKSCTRDFWSSCVISVVPMVADATAIVCRHDRVATTGRRGLVAAGARGRHARGREGRRPHRARSGAPRAAARRAAARPPARGPRRARRRRGRRAARPGARGAADRRRSRAAAGRLGEDDRRSLLERADAICAHRFDLLGSGPVELGPRSTGATDFKTGRRWPLVHISQVPIVFGDGSDIKVPWELTRFQHLPLLAAAHRLTGEARYLDEIGAQLDSLDRRATRSSSGPTGRARWTSRSAPRIGSPRSLMVAEARPPWLDRAVASLLLHGRFIRSHLEWGETRGNHYLSDIVGLLPVAALFSGGARGPRAGGAGRARELAAEMEHQVRPDGCDHEASIPYHRLVTELFVCRDAGGRLAGCPDAFTPRLSRAARARCCASRPPTPGPTATRRWSATTTPAASCRSTSTATATARTCTCSAGRAGRPHGHAAFPDSGYWVMRGGDLWALVRCGDVGLQRPRRPRPQRRAELRAGARRPAAGRRSRHVRLHAGPRRAQPVPLDRLAQHAAGRRRGAEPAPLGLPVRDGGPRAGRGRSSGRRATTAAPHSPAATRASPAPTHERRLEFDGPAGTLVLHDTVPARTGATLSGRSRSRRAPRRARCRRGDRRDRRRAADHPRRRARRSRSRTAGTRPPTACASRRRSCAPAARAAGEDVQRITLSAARAQ